MAIHVHCMLLVPNHMYTCRCMYMYMYVQCKLEVAMWSSNPQLFCMAYMQRRICSVEQGWGQTYAHARTHLYEGDNMKRSRDLFAFGFTPVTQSSSAVKSVRVDESGTLGHRGVCTASASSQSLLSLPRVPYMQGDFGAYKFIPIKTR